jgi:hypothetical protein
MTQIETGFETLLVRQVKGLVTATADIIAESTGGDPLEIEAHLHKVLAVNCETAALTAQALAAEPGDPAEEQDSEDHP